MAETAARIALGLAKSGGVVFADAAEESAMSATNGEAPAEVPVERSAEPRDRSAAFRHRKRLDEAMHLLPRATIPPTPATRPSSASSVPKQLEETCQRPASCASGRPRIRTLTPPEMSGCPS
jgi:hypothetical protein